VIDVALEAGSVPPAEDRDLGRVLRCVQVPRTLARLLAPAGPRTSLRLRTGSLSRIDAYGAAALRIGIDAQLTDNSARLITLLEPANAETWELLSDLMGGTVGLPSRSAWAGTRPPARRGARVIIPALPLPDEDTVSLLVDEALPRATEALGYGARSGRLLQEATAVLAENAMVHALPAQVAPVLCASFERQGNDLQTAVIDLGAGVPAPELGADPLREALERSERAFGGLATLKGLSRGGLEWSLRLAWGKGRASRRAGRWVFREDEFLPGFMAGVEIHR
jgi:hypothetical protein